MERGFNIETISDDCAYCKGEGRTVDHTPNADWEYLGTCPIYIECGKCEGTGKIGHRLKTPHPDKCKCVWCASEYGYRMSSITYIFSTDNSQ